MRRQGKVIEWNDARGLGFVVTHGEDQRVFVHINQFAAGRTRRPRQGDILVYEVRRGERGKMVADGVRFAKGVNPRRQPARRSRWGFAEMVIVLLGLGLVAMVTTGKLPWQIAAGYPLLSALTWLVYRKDKQAAGRGGWRTPESTLQLLALLGGWPGAWLAQKHLRHKSSKPGFQLAFRLMVGVNLAVLLWLARVRPLV